MPFLFCWAFLFLCKRPTFLQIVLAAVSTVPLLHGKIDGKQWKQWQTLFWGAPKSLKMVIAAMKLKDACSLEEKL